MKSRKFIDSVILFAKAGNGGNGSVSFRREKYIPMGGPDGGDGGKGGDVILQGDYDTDSLIKIFFVPQRQAEHGGHGRGQQMYGKCGKDLIIQVPCGTEIWNSDTGEMIGEIVKHGEEVIVAKGGKGGLGNVHWKSSTHQTPLEHTEGELGEEVNLRLELKIVADIGLIGFPNAGKSSILAAISHAHPKIAAYPFTTLNPIIGTIKYDDFFTLKIADIPGIIKGAHEGVGLGYEFLKHIERSKTLVYVIDMAGYDGRIPHEDYANLKKEVKLYGKDIQDKPFIVVANKMDLPEAAENLKTFKKKTKTKPLILSALNKTGIDELKEALRTLTEKQ